VRRLAIIIGLLLAGLLVAAPAHAQTPTPTATITATVAPLVATVTLPGGEYGVVEYSATFGEMSNTVGVIGLLALAVFNLIYSVVLQFYFINRVNNRLDAIALHTQLMVAEWRKRQVNLGDVIQ